MTENVVHMDISFMRLTDEDSKGILVINNFAWPHKFAYQSNGDTHVVKSPVILEDSYVPAFGNELQDLIRKYFGDVPSLTIRVENQQFSVEK